MLSIPRSTIRDFRSLFKKCTSQRIRSPTSSVLIHAEENQLTITAANGGVVLQWQGTNVEGSGSFVMSLSVLEAMEGISDSVNLTSKSKWKAMARWSHRGIPQELVVDVLPPKLAPAMLDLPHSWSPLSEGLLQGFHEVAKTAARESQRYDLHCLQIQGEKGQILATDGQQVLIQSGILFPFPETIHIPALPVFGVKELEGLPARLGRMETHFVVEIGAWRIWLPIHADAKFPNLDDIVSPKRGSTAVHLSETDAAFLLDLLPKLPGYKEESSPITLDVDSSGVMVRAQGKDEQVVEEALIGSKFTGPPLRVCLDRRFLMRALALGCRRLRMTDPTRPLIALSDQRLYVAILLDDSLCLGPQETPPTKALAPLPEPLENPMPQKPEPEATPTDLLTEAENLRTAVLDIAQRISRLIGMLKSKKKEERALTQVWTSLKSLQLGGPR